VHDCVSINRANVTHVSHDIQSIHDHVMISADTAENLDDVIKMHACCPCQCMQGLRSNPSALDHGIASDIHLLW
jgi:hypothetical protein